MKKITLSMSLNMTSRNINTFALNGNGDKVYANSQNMIHFKLDLSEYKYASFYKVKLRFKQSNSSTAEASLAEATEYGMHSSNARDVKSVVEGSTYYREVDVTSFYTDENLVKYFAILCENSELGLYTDSSTYSPEVTIEYICDEESTVNQKYVEGTAGRALNYAVNIRSGRPIFTKGLLENETTVIPLILGLFYDPLNSGVSKYMMPKGWNFSYNQMVYREFLEYKYIDGSGLLHTFETATSAVGNSNVYFDSSGSGLILKVNDDEIIIDDGYNNYLHFNINRGNGRLIDLNLEGHLSKVRKVFGNHTFELIFERGTSNELKAVHERIKENDTVVETNNNLITISYNNNNTITLQATDYPTVTLTKDGSGYLTSVKEEDDRLSTYTYSNDMLKTATSDNGEVTSFTYDNSNRVKVVTDYVTNIENVVNKLTFKYGNFNTFVTNNFGIKMGYVFNEDGILIGEYEESGSKYQRIKYVDVNDEGVKTDSGQSDQYIAYEDMEITGQDGVKDLVSLEGALETNLTDHYKLTFTYILDKDNTDFDKKSYIKVYQGNDIVGEKELNLRRFEDTVCSFSFRFIKVAPIVVKVFHENNNSSKLTIKNIFMMSLKKYFSTVSNIIRI